MRNKHKATDDECCLETVIFGKNLKELFENAAFEMYSLVAKPDTENKKKPLKITVTASNTEGLLMAFLKELLHYYSVRKILLCSVNVMLLTENKVHAKLTGEELNRRHHIVHDIKSARYANPLCESVSPLRLGDEVSEARALARRAKYSAANGDTKIVKTRTGYKTQIVFGVNSVV
ncbi:MAG: archease [Elusimicrobiota bacterium]